MYNSVSILCIIMYFICTNYIYIQEIAALLHVYIQNTHTHTHIVQSDIFVKVNTDLFGKFKIIFWKENETSFQMSQNEVKSF